MKIHLERTGGFTGIPLTGTLDTDQLSPEDSQSLRELVESSGFFSLEAKIPSSGGGADRFTYLLTIEAGERSHTVEIGETGVPGALQALIQRVTLLVRQRRIAPEP